MTTLKVSRGMGNHLLCVRSTKSGANMHMMIQSTNTAPFMIVHHMKNVSSVLIPIIFLLNCFHHPTYFSMLFYDLESKSTPRTCKNSCAAVNC